MEYFLRQIGPNVPHRAINIELNKAIIVIGTKSKPSLARYEKVCREHACFARDQGQWCVQDLCNSTGLYVNGRKIEGVHNLQIGDIIGFGAASFESGAFVCSVSVKNPFISKGEIEVIDLSDDEQCANEVNADERACGENAIKLEKPPTVGAASCSTARQNLEFSESSEALRSHLPTKTVNKSAVEEFSRKMLNNFEPIEHAVHKETNLKCAIEFGLHVEEEQKSNSPIPSKREQFQVKNCCVPLVRCDEESPVVPLSLKKEKSKILPKTVKTSEHVSLLPASSLHDRLSNELFARKHLWNEAGSSFAPHESEVSRNKEIKEIRLNAAIVKPVTPATYENSYSRNEDFTYNSDEESYLDFNSSQASPENEADQRVFLDNESNCSETVFRVHRDKCMNANDALQNVPSEEESVMSESIENITKYIFSGRKSLQTKDEITPLEVENDFFPDLSQEFFDETDQNSNCSSVSSHSDIKYPSQFFSESKPIQSENNMELDKTGSINKKETKPTRKTQLTDARPLHFRPRRLCGRDEGFVERNKRNVYGVNASSGRKRGLNKKKHSSLMEKIKKPGKEGILSLRNKNTFSSNTNRPKRVKTGETSSVNKTLSSEKRVKTQPTDVKDSKKFGKKKMSTVRRRRDSFSSRAGSLIAEMQKETTSPKRAVRKKTGETTTEIPLAPQYKNSKGLGRESLKRRISGENFKTPLRKISFNDDGNLSSSLSVNETNRRILVPSNIRDHQKNTIQPSRSKIVIPSALSEGTKSSVLPPEQKESTTVTLNNLPHSSINRLKKVRQTPDAFFSRTATSVAEVQKETTSRTRAETTEEMTAKIPSVSQDINGKGLSTQSFKSTISDENFKKPFPDGKNLSSAVKLNKTNRELSVSPKNKIIQPFSNEIARSCDPIKSTEPSRGSKNKKPSCVVLPNKLQKKHTFASLNDKLPTMIRKIVEWNTKWLKEQKSMKAPPPDVSNGAAPLNLHYESFNSYASSFFPMIMLETWAMTYEESKSILEVENPVKNKFYFVILSAESKDDMIELQCQAPVNKIAFSPCKGNLILMQLKHQYNSTICSTLGYINSHNELPYESDALINPEYKKLPKIWLDGAKSWQFTVLTKNRVFFRENSSLHRANSICYIENKLRLAEALLNLQYSPMLNDILRPNPQTFSIDYPTPSPSSEFTHLQKRFIEGVSAEIQKEHTDPKIILLNGPPGTGKTHTIVGLLKNLVYNNEKKTKVLVTAPSNADVDEIGCRLIDLKDEMSWNGNNIEFLRVGSTKQMHLKMLPFALDERVKNLQICQPGKESGIKVNAVEAKRRRLMEQKNSSDSQNIDGTLKNLQFDYCTLQKYETIIMAADIILLTLDSYELPAITSLLKPNSDKFFQCCIVDNANRCTEIDILQPLVLGMRKIILVGDHQQLPATLSSKMAIECGFERSMFERFHLYFQNYNQQSPVFTLNQQFRMHSEICSFPSKYFYEQNLTTCLDDTDIKYEFFPVRPYIMLNVQENCASTNIYSNEALVTASICDLLLQITPTTSVGIIAPYEALEILRYALFDNSRQKDLEVNTVEGFQGREKDVVFVSCFRTNNQSENIDSLASKKLLNVAITRARQCLIICAQVSSLISDPHWKALVHDARERKVFYSLSSPEEASFLFNKTMLKRK